MIHVHEGDIRDGFPAVRGRLIADVNDLVAFGPPAAAGPFVFEAGIFTGFITAIMTASVRAMAAVTIQSPLEIFKQLFDRRLKQAGRRKLLCLRNSLLPALSPDITSSDEKQYLSECMISAYPHRRNSFVPDDF